MKTSRLVLLLSGFKLICLAIVVVFGLLWPSFFNNKNYYYHFPWPTKPPSLESRFLTWDTSHYLYLAENGYQKGQMSCNFFPLWPGMIRLASFLFLGHSLIAGLVLANVLSLAAFVLLHGFLKQKDPVLADGALFFLCIFPGSVFYLFAYSESLFLLLGVLFFIFLFQKKYLEAGLSAFLLTLSRPLGLTVILVVLYEFIQCCRREKLSWRHFVFLLSVPAAVFVYLILMHAQTGNAFEFLNVQQFYAAKHSVSGLLNFKDFFRDYISFKNFHGDVDSFFDRFLFTIFICSLPVIWKYDKRFFWFTLPLGILPPLTGSFMSYTRYLSVIFPFFVMMADIFSKSPILRFRKLAIAVMLALFLVFLIHHSNYGWAG